LSLRHSVSDGGSLCCLLCRCLSKSSCRCFDLTCVSFLTDTATTEIYTLSLHDALPIWERVMAVTYRGGLAESVNAAVAEVTLSRSEEHTSELQSRENLVCRLLLEKKQEGRKGDDGPCGVAPTRQGCEDRTPELTGCQPG